MKVYIAGKITGNPEYKKHFAAAEKKFIEDGHLVMNPAVLPEGFGFDDYMPICYAMIDCCDAVAFLPNWTDSKGAGLEYGYAITRLKQMIFQREDVK